MKIEEQPLYAGGEMLLSGQLGCRIYGPGDKIFAVLSACPFDGEVTFYHGESIHFIEAGHWPKPFNNEAFERLRSRLVDLHGYLVKALPECKISTNLGSGTSLGGF